MDSSLTWHGDIDGYPSTNSIHIYVHTDTSLYLFAPLFFLLALPLSLSLARFRRCVSFRFLMIESDVDERTETNFSELLI